MPLKSTLERLEEVQDAISAVLLNQSYTLGGRSITRANLGALREMEDALLDRYNRETGTKRRIMGVDFNAIS